MPTNFESLPDDIVYVLGKYLNKGHSADAYNFMLLSTRIRKIVLPIVYSNVHLRNDRQCKYTLLFLKKYPYIASYVRQLCVKPLPDAEQEGMATEDEVVALIEDLIPGLRYLTSFSWNGSSMPGSSIIWHNLQNMCPDLVDIATTITEQDPYCWDDNTSFLKLRNLSSLTVMFRESPETQSPPRYIGKFPSSFWGIVHPSRSPMLRKLSFQSDLLRSFNLNALFAMNLPSLRNLIIGTFLLKDFSSDQFCKFIGSTPLQCFEVSPVARIPWDDISMPAIKHYGGNFYSILAGAAHWTNLQSMDISCFSVSFDRFYSSIRRSSKIMTLTSLKLRVHGDSCPPIINSTSTTFGGHGTSCEEYYSALISNISYCYPNLTSLSIICCTKENYSWETAFPRLLGFPQLLSLYLDEVLPYTTSNVVSTAIAAMKVHPGLEHVDLRRAAQNWFQTSEYRPLDKAVLRHITRSPPSLSVHQYAYDQAQPQYSSSISSLASL